MKEIIKVLIPRPISAPLEVSVCEHLIFSNKKDAFAKLNRDKELFFKGYKVYKTVDTQFVIYREPIQFDLANLR